MNDYIRRAFKSLEDLQVVIEPVKSTLREDLEVDIKEEPETIRDLFEDEKSFIVVYDFEDDGINYSVFFEALNEDGESCDLLFDAFDINAIDEILVEVLDGDREFLGSLTEDNDFTLDTALTEVIGKAKAFLNGEETEEVTEIEEVPAEGEEVEVNEREFIAGEPEVENEELLVEESVKLYSEDEIFDAVDGSLKHGGGIAINVDGKVFVCDVDDVPENGVPADGNFEFTGCEVTANDIGTLDDGELYMDGCQAEKHYVVKNGRIVSEELTEKCEGEECDKLDLDEAAEVGELSISNAINSIIRGLADEFSIGPYKDMNVKVSVGDRTDEIRITFEEDVDLNAIEKYCQQVLAQSKNFGNKHYRAGDVKKNGREIVLGYIDYLGEGLTESQKFDLYDEEQVEEAEEDIEELKNATTNDEVMQIVDASAESTDELRDSYIGGMVLQCPVCKATMFKDMDQLVKEEDGDLYNVDEECPHCGSKGGFDLIGQLAKPDVNPFGEEPAPEAEAPVEEPVASEEEEVTIEAEPLPELPAGEESKYSDLGSLFGESIQSNNKNILLEKINPESLADWTDAQIQRKIRSIEETQLKPSQNNLARGPASEATKDWWEKAMKPQYEKYIKILQDDIATLKAELEKRAQNNDAQDSSQQQDNQQNTNQQNDELFTVGTDFDSYDPYAQKVCECLRDGLNKIYAGNKEITGPIGIVVKDNEVVIVVSKKYTPKIGLDYLQQAALNVLKQDNYIPTNVKQVPTNWGTVIVFDGILRQDTQTVQIPGNQQPQQQQQPQQVRTSGGQAVMAQGGQQMMTASLNTRKTGDVILESLDENKFDKLVIKYLKETYTNIKNYRTTDAAVDDTNNKLIIEGLITFNSGKEKKTTFIFEAKEMTNKNQLKLVGINETFASGKAFTLLAGTNNGKLLSESLAYRYTIDDKKVKGKAQAFQKR